MGGIFSAQFGLAPVYAAEAGMSVAQVSIFVAMFFVGALLLQYPIGWLSDRTSRRTLISVVCLVGTGGAVIGLIVGQYFTLLLVSIYTTQGM